MWQPLHHRQFLAIDEVLKKIDSIDTKANFSECKTIVASQKQIESWCSMYQDFGTTSSWQFGAWIKLGGFISNYV